MKSKRSKGRGMAASGSRSGMRSSSETKSLFLNLVQSGKTGESRNDVYYRFNRTICDGGVLIESLALLDSMGSYCSREHRS